MEKNVSLVRDKGEKMKKINISNLDEKTLEKYNLISEIKTEARFREIMNAVAVLSKECFNANFSAGWHNNLETGEYISFEDSFYEKLGLSHSELSEALEHFRKGNRPDDKLQWHSGVRVELCDALIRIFGMLGQMDNDNQEIGLSADAFAEKMVFNSIREDHKIESRKAEGGKKA